MIYAFSYLVMLFALLINEDNILQNHQQSLLQINKHY